MLICVWLKKKKALCKTNKTHKHTDIARLNRHHIGKCTVVFEDVIVMDSIDAGEYTTEGKTIDKCIKMRWELHK